MLGIGWGEMLVIAIVVLIVVGPKDLPMMLRNIGRAMGTVRRMSNEFRREIDKAVAADELREAKKAITDPLQKTSSEISREFNSIRNGKFEPSGKLKPSDPAKESVDGDIRARAGLPPAKPTAAVPVGADKPVVEKPVPAIGNAGTTSAGATVKASEPRTKSAAKNAVTSRASSSRTKEAEPTAKSKPAAKKPKTQAKAEDAPKAPRKTARKKKAASPKAATRTAAQAPGGEG